MFACQTLETFLVIAVVLPKLGCFPQWLTRLSAQDYNVRCTAMGRARQKRQSLRDKASFENRNALSSAEAIVFLAVASSSARRQLQS